MVHGRSYDNLQSLIQALMCRAAAILGMLTPDLGLSMMVRSAEPPAWGGRGARGRGRRGVIAECMVEWGETFE